MTFSFLGELRHVPNGHWIVETSRLWCYNLNYFDDLNAFGAVSRRPWHMEAIACWINDNPVGLEAAWDPYPTSLRIVNWTKWALSGASLDESVVESLAIQARVLERRLEYHLFGNHLFANAKALVFSGLYFQGAEADRWLEKGLSILAREFPEQILPDGGHFERSPMYHALALEDVLDLINIAAAFPTDIPAKWQQFVASWPEVAQRMRRWLRAMCHPDGEIALFNDAAMGIAPSPAELERYASELRGALPQAKTDTTEGVQLLRLTESGYLRADAPDAVMLMDVAPIGPDYLPGHAHADTLSFELSLFGQRVIVNGGTSQYGLGPGREAERGTAAHSTVTVDGKDSSEVWAGFRVARRARPFDLAVHDSAGSIQISCAHDGYRRLPGRPVHRRSWHMEEGMLRVEDRVEGGLHASVARFHVHPSVRFTVDESGNAGTLRLPGDRSARWRAVRGTARVEASVYCPEFGRRDVTRCLALELNAAGESILELAW